MRSKLRVALPIAAGLVALACLGTGLLYLLPALLLVAVFVCGVFPGEEALLAHGGARRSVRPPVVSSLGSAGRTPHATGPLGAALLAFKRATRPPPSPALV